MRFVRSSLPCISILSVSLIICFAAKADGFCANLSANSTSVRQGTVVDSNGAAAFGAKITLVHGETGGRRIALSDIDGFYQFEALPVGIYRMSVQLQGFKTHVGEKVVVEVGRTSVLNIELRIGDISKQVYVTADSPLIDLSSVAVGQVIN